MKSEVYSWRVSPDIRTGLEREARRRKISVAAALDLAAREWLQKCGREDGEDQEQARLHAAASRWIGRLAGGDVHRAENVRRTVRERLRRQHGR